MIRKLGSLVAVASLGASLAPAGPGVAPVVASIEATMRTEGQNIGQLAFDGDPGTFYASDKSAGKHDRFTLAFDRPVKVSELAVLVGRDDKDESSDRVKVLVSADGSTFEDAAKPVGREAKVAFPGGREVKAVRIVPTEDLSHPLTIREISVKSDPAVTTFRWPVEFVVDVSDAPEMKDWAEGAARACERAYPMICEELKSDGYTPARLISMTLSSSYQGVAQAAGTRITGSVKFFKDHPDDVGAMVHETTHVVQRYRSGGNPSWLVEGVADYVRFFKYEPGKIGRIDPERARYDASYRTTAAFLAYVVEKYDKSLILDLNRAMREGKYREEIFKERTGKPLKELGDEWKATLKK